MIDVNTESKIPDILLEVELFIKAFKQDDIYTVLTAEGISDNYLFSHDVLGISTLRSVVWDHAATEHAWSFWINSAYGRDNSVLVPTKDVKDHYVANHLKGTTCSVDVSEVTGNAQDRVYGKLREYDCLGSDGNTLLYDLESANFDLKASSSDN